MLGLGTTTASIDSANIYKELSELENYADLDIWFDFSTQLTAAHGTEVTTVRNLGQTGALTNYVNSNEGTPLVDRTTLSRPCVVFDGSDEVLDFNTSYSTAGKACTFFIVLQRNDVSNDYVVANADDGATDFVRFTASGATIQTGMAEQTAVSTNTNNTNNSTIDYTQVANVPTVIAFRRIENGSMYFYADNGLFIAQKTNSAIKAADNFTFGAIGGTTSGSLSDLTGFIGEVGLYDADIGEAAIITLTKELSTKWGINRRS